MLNIDLIAEIKRAAKELINPYYKSLIIRQGRFACSKRVADKQILALLR
jgi:hypothetical protein